MAKLFRFAASFAVLFAIFGFALVSGAGAASTASTQGYTFNVAYNSTVGNYLVTSQGYTLYNNGNSPCSGGCASIWIPYYNSNAISLPPGLNSSDFGIVNLTSGGKQFTYLGKRLYTFYEDTAPGQINGNGVENIWHVATVSNYTGASTNSATTAKNIATNSTAPNALKTNTTATTSNTTAGKVVNTSKSSTSSSANSSVPTLSSSNYTSLPSQGKQNNSNTGLYIAVVVIIVIIVILAYVYMRKK